MKKKILFSDEQYKQLVKVVFYGEWVLNATKLGDENMDKEAIDIRNYVYGQKDRFSLGDWFHQTNDGLELNEDITFDLVDKVFEYNEESFWPDLVRKLAVRDTLEEVLQSEEFLSESEKEDILFKNEEKYEKAFHKNGIQGLRLID